MGQRVLLRLVHLGIRLARPAHLKNGVPPKGLRAARGDDPSIGLALEEDRVRVGACAVGEGADGLGGGGGEAGEEGVEAGVPEGEEEVFDVRAWETVEGVEA